MIIRKTSTSYYFYIFLCLMSFISCTPRSNENVDLLENEIGQPIIDTTDNSDTYLKPVNNEVLIPRVKIYIENTLSMYGYMPSKKKVNTKFRDAVNELLIVSKKNYERNNTELSLINNETTVNVNSNFNLDFIDEYSLGVKYSKGRGSSDFDKLFEKIIEDFEQYEINVFIADFIYSPGSTDVESGLNRLRQNITEAFQIKREFKSLAVNIFHLESDFHGDYYDINNERREGIKTRPYYIFIIGKEGNVRKYSEEVRPKLAKYDLKHSYHITSDVSQIDEYAALPYTLNVGQFATINSSSNKSLIVKNTISNESRVQLAISANLSDVSVSKEYLMDVNNYEFNSNDIELINVGEIEDKHIKFRDGKKLNINPSDIDYSKNDTHVFLLSFPNTYSGPIKLSLNKNIPSWIEEVSIKDGENDFDIETNVLKQSQTFGFSYIVRGIYDAQRTIDPKRKHFQITLNVSQQNPSSGLGGIIGLIVSLLIIVIIVIIIFKNKQRK